MCAICGMVNVAGLEERAVEDLLRVRDAMVHRGPDDAGLFRDAHAALGVRRLSVIDVAGGHQPIPNEDRTIWVAFNGEIYNYRALRAEAEAAGHQFTTQTDTEALVHLYELHGDRFLDGLRGMFALAIWDAPRRRLLLARDRVGIKPLYYGALPNHTLLFASELKGLLRHPAVSRTLDPDALDQYLLHEYVPAPRTIVRGIHKLLPGHYLIADAQGTRTERYWEIPDGPPQCEWTLESAATAFRGLLRDSVQHHLASDVPLGLLLSGGLDSSAIAALAAPCRPPAFTIGFDEASFDETAPAQRVAAHFGLEHHTVRITPSDVGDILDQAVAACDEPLGDSSMIATWFLSRLARSRVTVALSGDGGDELFGGYPTYLAHRWAAHYDRLPAFVRERCIEPLVRRLPVSTANMSFDFKASRFIRGAGLPAAQRHSLWMGAFGPTEKTRLFSPALTAATAQNRRAPESIVTAPVTRDVADQMMALDRRTYLPDDLLAKVDRMSMAHGLEVRVPFLDHAIVEFAAGLPAALSLRGGRTKTVVRRALQGLVPPDILGRPKKGFGMPIAEWLRGSLRPRVASQLAPRRLARHGLWNPDYVQQLLREHWGGRHNHAKLLWTLFMFETWHEEYLR
ncbi:MAG: asparagine synthase (glutamine-hydrolyzing) [Omnitrophica bacterium RIFCSPHIGHO2_02_FULL_63_14]|nr:MAG: asparagine synthase (glutamine-hydrolyzing) [Omnitrophica bacterium RIFCSPHIGHO2_02_FULL_63_14]